MTKIFVLSSGGLDSTTCIAKAIAENSKEDVESISIHYGQKHDRELKAAEDVAEYYNIVHHELCLASIFKMLDNPLMKGSEQEIELTSYEEQTKEDPRGKVKTYIPFRNGLFLSVIASYALSIYPEEDIQIWIGVHADDSAGNAYADTSKGFIDEMSNAISKGTYEQVSVKAPFVSFSKAAVVQVGLGLSVPYEKTWSCYNGGEKACGKCATCRDRLKAFELNGKKDPIEYQES